MAVTTANEAQQTLASLQKKFSEVSTDATMTPEEKSVVLQDLQQETETALEKTEAKAEPEADAEKKVSADAKGTGQDDGSIEAAIKEGLEKLLREIVKAYPDPREEALAQKCRDLKEKNQEIIDKYSSEALEEKGVIHSKDLDAAKEICEEFFEDKDAIFTVSEEEITFSDLQEHDLQDLAGRLSNAEIDFEMKQKEGAYDCEDGKLTDKNGNEVDIDADRSFRPAGQ